MADKFAYLALKGTCTHSFRQAHSFNVQFSFHGRVIHCSFRILWYRSDIVFFVLFWFVMFGVIFFVSLSLGRGRAFGRYSSESLLVGLSMTDIVE